MKKLLARASVLAWLFFASAISAEISEEKKFLIDEIIELQGSAFVGDELAYQLATELRDMSYEADVEVSDEFFEIIMSVVSEVIYDEFVLSGELAELSYSAWGSQFEAEELREIVSFYKSPLGESFISKFPKVDDSVLAGFMQFQERVQPMLEKRFEKRLARAGFDLDELSGGSRNIVQGAPTSSDAEIKELEKQVCVSQKKGGKRLPVFRGRPVYPYVARLFGIEGWVDVSFTIKSNGDTSNMRVIESSNGTIFDAAAIASVVDYKYCRGKKAKNQSIRISFKMSDEGETKEKNIKSKADVKKKKLGRYDFLDSAKFLSSIEAYGSDKPGKALYIAGDEGGGYVFQWHSGHRTQSEADNAAEASCEARRIKKRILNSCEPLLLGAKLVKKFEKISKLISAVESMHGDDYEPFSGWERFMEKYKNLGSSKALAITENEDGAYHVFDSYNWGTQDEANSNAIKNCQDNKPDHLTGNCRLYMIDNYLVDDVPKLHALKGLWEGNVYNQVAVIDPDEQRASVMSVRLNNCGEFPTISIKDKEGGEFNAVNRIFKVIENAGNIVLLSVEDGGDWVETQNWTLVKLNNEKASVQRNRMVSNVNVDIEDESRSFGNIGSGRLNKVEKGCEL